MRRVSEEQIDHLASLCYLRADSRPHEPTDSIPSPLRFRGTAKPSAPVTRTRTGTRSRPNNKLLRTLLLGVYVTVEINLILPSVSTLRFGTIDARCVTRVDAPWWTHRGRTVRRGRLLIQPNAIDRALASHAQAGNAVRNPANVAMIINSALLMVLVKKQVGKKPFALAAVVGLVAYIIFIVIFLVMSQTPRGTVFWILFAGTIALWLLSLVFGFKSSEKYGNGEKQVNGFASAA